MEELNKNNKSSEEIEEFIPEEADFITDDNIDLTPKKERKIIKKSKKLEKIMQEEGLTEIEVYQKYGDIDGQFSNTTPQEEYEEEPFEEYDEEEETHEEVEKKDKQEEKEEEIEEEDDEEVEEEEDEEEDKATLVDSGEFPEEITDLKLECIYIGLLLNNPKAISMYYFVYDECLFSDEELANIYKIILFQDGETYAPAVAKDKFKFPKENTGTYDFKMQLKNAVQDRNYNLEETYTKLKKLFILKKFYKSAPTVNIQNKIVEIAKYERYSEMTIEEVESAIEQIGVTNRLSQAILNDGATEFLISGDNNLVNGVPLPFPILSSVFKGLRKGETMAYAMPSNSGKSRFAINLAAYTAFVNKKKVLIISNEMSEEKMKLCLITTIVNNPEIQKIHGQKISITENEILALQFKPDNPNNVNVDEEGHILKEKNETQKEFIQRLQKESTEFNKVIAVTDWINKEINNSIYFMNITDHTNDELKKVIMNYYYKEKIEYIFYDTLKTDTANIGNAEEIKKTATILSNIAQNFEVFICSSLQLTESSTLPVNLDVNDLAVSRTVKEVLDTLCLIKQINRDNLQDYEYSLKEVDTTFYDLKKYEDPDVRYYACVVDKNRAGPKPKLVFKLNLAYNSWEELGYLRLKQSPNGENE